MPVVITCAFCGTPTPILPYRAKRGQKYCGESCRLASRKHAALERTSKFCFACERELPAENFHKRNDGRLRPYCRDCEIVKDRLNIRVRPSKYKKYTPSPKKVKARTAVATAKDAGRLMPRPCEICGAAAQAHHTDYDKPLEVRWLCSKHHAMEHWRPVNTPLLDQLLKERQK